MDPSQIPPDVPIMRPPPGHTSNFAHKEDHRLFVQIVVTLVICVVLSTVSVAARVVTRLWFVKMFGWDDGLAVLAILLNYGLTVCFAGEIVSGLAFSTYNTSLRDFMMHYFDDWTFWNSVFTIFLYFTFAAIKLSILMLYLRLLGPTHKRLRIGVWVLAGLVMVILIGTTAALLNFCHPVQKLFRPQVPGTCNISAVLFVVQAVAQIVTDLLILIPPIPVVWRLNASSARRVGFILTLCIGLFVTGIGLARLGILITQLNSPNLTIDIQYLGTYLAIFEINFAIVAICIPALRQLFVKMQQVYSSYRSKTSQPSSGPSNRKAFSPTVGNIRVNNRRPLSENHVVSDGQYVDGPYTELGEVAQWGDGKDKEYNASTITKTESNDKDSVTLGLRRDNGRIGTAA